MKKEEKSKAEFLKFKEDLRKWAHHLQGFTRRRVWLGSDVLWKAGHILHKRTTVDQGCEELLVELGLDMEGCSFRYLWTVAEAARKVYYHAFLLHKWLTQGDPPAPRKLCKDLETLLKEPPWWIQMIGRRNLCEWA